jgi:hypothetical protein
MKSIQHTANGSIDNMYETMKTKTNAVVEDD